MNQTFQKRPAGKNWGVLALETAVAQILAALPASQSEVVPGDSATGRVLAETLYAGVDLPPFNNSAMDGYAVRAADVALAAAPHPVRLRLSGRVAAGETFAGEIGPGECARIFTGAPLPPGTDAVVMQEDTRAGGTDIWILEPARPGENVRLQGGDVRRGSVIATAGTELSPGLIGLLGATGIGEVRVGRRARVALIATGSELRESPARLLPGQIYECNRAMLGSLVAQAGAVAEIFPLVADSLAETRAALETGFQRADIVITSGGVSVGETDFVKEAFAALGGIMQFWKVAIRPGKPFVFGRWQNKFLLGLPGNPVSAIVTFLLLVRPALRRWVGATDVFLPPQRGILAESLTNPGERRHFMRVRIDAAGRVSSSGQQASHSLASLAAANALLDIPPQTELSAGTPVTVLRFA